MRTLASSLQRIEIAELVAFVALLFTAIIAPLSGHQLITGPVVNAVLFLSVSWLGVRTAASLAILPSIVALVVGLLPSIMAPAVPFIMAGNLLLVMVFDRFRKNFVVGVLLASIAKFTLLFLSGSLVTEVLITGEVSPAIVGMMGWNQLFTALMGGLIARIILFLRE